MNDQKPKLEFFGNIVGETFAGHLYFQRKPIAATIMRLPGIGLEEPADGAPKKQAGRPKITAQDITLLAHEALIKKCNPGARLDAATVRMVALEVIAGKKDAADPDEYATKKSTIEKRLKRAKEAITGMTVCTFTSASEKVGEWMALGECYSLAAIYAKAPTAEALYGE